MLNAGIGVLTITDHLLLYSNIPTASIARMLWIHLYILYTFPGHLLLTKQHLSTIIPWYIQKGNVSGEHQPHAIRGTGEADNALMDAAVLYLPSREAGPHPSRDTMVE